MTYNIVITRIAENDLMNIKFCISEILKNQHGADKTLRKLLNSIISLSYFPYKYRIISNNVHIYTISSYSIYYHIKNNDVIILRVLGNKQQFNYYDIFN